MIDKLNSKLISVINEKQFDNITKRELLESLFSIIMKIDDIADEEWMFYVNGIFIEAIESELSYKNTPLLGTIERELFDRSFELDREAKPKDFDMNSELSNASVFNQVRDNLLNGNYLKHRDLN